MVGTLPLCRKGPVAQTPCKGRAEYSLGPRHFGTGFSKRARSSLVRPLSSSDFALILSIVSLIASKKNLSLNGPLDSFEANILARSGSVPSLSSGNILGASWQAAQCLA